MKDQTADVQKSDEQVNAQVDPEITAIQAILSALTGLKPEQRQRVIDYVFQRLGLETPSSIASPSIESSFANSPPALATTATVRDIRSFKEQKKPRSANEMATLVAYYLAELAPEGSRKSEIGTEDIVTYFKQAGYPLPAVLRNTLVNAKSAGYFDSASHGLYKLNPVGHNLVAHGLPPTGNQGKISGNNKRAPRKSGGKLKGAKHR